MESSAPRIAKKVTGKNSEYTSSQNNGSWFKLCNQVIVASERDNEISGTKREAKIGPQQVQKYNRLQGFISVEKDGLFNKSCQYNGCLKEDIIGSLFYHIKKRNLDGLKIWK